MGCSNIRDKIFISPNRNLRNFPRLARSTHAIRSISSKESVKDPFPISFARRHNSKALCRYSCTQRVIERCATELGNLQYSYTSELSKVC